VIAFLAQSPFGEVATLLVMAAAVGLVGPLLRQPLIVNFIAVGLIAGRSALNVVRSDERINLLAELGIAVLLFQVGIKLDTKLVRSLGPISLMTGPGQVAFTSIFGFQNELAPAGAEEQRASGADIVLEPFQDAADRAVERLSGAARSERTERTTFPDIETDE
jgi:hypothetical protein